MAAAFFAGPHLRATDNEPQPRREERGGGNKICRVCEDEIGVTDNGQIFVACNECGFPVCKPCYEYERSEGNQCCPRCSTRYKRHKGCPRVVGDDEEHFEGEEFDQEFQTTKNHPYSVALNTSTNIHENGDYHNNQLHIAGSVAGKDLEDDHHREVFTNDEWKDRIEKWKTKQEMKGLQVTRFGDDKDDEDEDDFL